MTELVPVGLTLRAMQKFADLEHQKQQEEAMKLIVEIRAGEGGEDAKLLVKETVSVYAKACSRSGL